MKTVRRLFRLSLLALASALAAATVRAQDLTITGWTLDPLRGLTLEYQSHAQSYFVLEQGAELAQIRHPADLALGVAGPATFSLPTPESPGAVFWRLRSIPQAAPLDLDGDGVDDVYELARRPVLNPLDPADALGDADGDRRTNLDEYRAGSDPLRYDAPEPPMLTTVADATMATLLQLRGTAAAGTYIRVDGGAALATNDVGSDGSFSVLVRLATNRVNRLFISSVDGQGVASVGRPIEVLQDSQPPNLYLDFPNRSQLTDSATIVAGRVGDTLSGYRGLLVWVHSSPSEGAPPLANAELPEESPWRANVDVGIGPNGTYQRADVPLAPGTNVVTVVAADLLGNRTTRRAELIRRPLEGPRLVAISGDRQATNVLRRAIDPVVVRAEDAGGAPLVGTELIFEVTRSDGRLLPVDTNQLAADWRLEPNAGPQGAMKVALRTDAAGEAKVWWTLGSDAGNANNRVCVMNAGISNTVFFCASALAHPARQINLSAGNNQKVETGGEVAEPLRVWVSDGLNAAPGTPVTFRVVQGQGRLIPGGRDGSVVSQLPDAEQATQMVVAAGLTGHASVGFVAGLNPGPNLVEASFPGLLGAPAAFVLYGVARDPDRPGTFTGLVLDNASNPLGNAYCSLSVGNYSMGTRSDPQGRFRFDDVPGGMGHLFVDGRTADLLHTNTIPTNSYPTLSYPVVTIANAENSLATPVLLPRKQPGNEQIYYGTNDLTLTCVGIEGLKMTIKANSMIHTNGLLVSPDNPAWVSLNQVHRDKIPMPMPDGAAPLFTWTLQPGGAHFDPPVEVAYPNLNALPPGSIAYFLSFNHDTERFEIVSSGHVVADGSQILSDPGSGISISGWGGNCPPYEVNEDVDACDPESATPSPDDYVFEDRPIVPNESNLHEGNELCGLTQSDGSLLSWCECDGSGERTIARIQLEFRVINKWYWAAITDPADIAFVTEHENRHVEVWRSYFEELRDNAQDINGVQYASESDCAKAIADYDAFALAEKEITEEIQRQVIDNLTERIRCELIQLKYSSANASRQVRPAGENEEFPEDAIFTVRKPVWKVSANGQSALVGNPRSFRLRGVSASDRFGPGGPGSPPDFLSDDLVRITGATVDEGDNRYFASDFFQLRAGQPTVVTAIHFSDTPPRIPDFIEAIPDAPTLTELGQTTRVRVTGRYADGSTGDLSARSEGTTYRVSNPGIATVDQNGAVTARRPGFALVAASNQGATAAAPLLVAPGDQLTRVVGRVQLSDGTPVAGAIVSVSGYAQGITGADGQFAIAGVPTGFGPVNVAAYGFVNGVRFSGVVRETPVQPGGESASGVILIAPEARRNAVIAAGSAHTLALRADGSLWSWGDNGSGQLGDGTSTDRRLPVRVGAETTWASVSAGPTYSAALQTDGSLWTWGANGQGQLGIGSTSLRRSPTRIGADRSWAQVATGARHAAALAADGSLWAWGVNLQGQLGDGTIVNQQAPIRIGADSDWAWVSAGDAHTLALKRDGSLWAWGEGGHGQLGDGQGQRRLEPTRVGADSDWWLVVAGGFHSVGIKRDGTLWAWGDNAWGQVGDGTQADVLAPVLVSPAQDWATISAGQYHTSALKLDGVRWAWGQNSEGELGNERRGARIVSPTRVGTTTDWIATVAGSDHTVGLTAQGRLWTWGNNDFGALGSARLDNQSRPIQVGDEQTWRRLTSGDGHAAGIAEDGALSAWGFNFTGQVGNGNFDTQLSPIAIDAAAWADVQGGGQHTVALRTDGTVWSWGENLVGQLGAGSSAPRSVPLQVGVDSDWAAVAAGGSHTLAIRQSGQLWAWGANNQGQVGDGATTARRSPVLVSAESDWTFVTAGARHSAGIRTDGTLWAWGDNGQGQLGLGDRDDEPRPARVGDASGWVQVDAGRDHTAALRADGSLWLWGDNSAGQLGDGTTTDQLIPQRLGAESDWQRVAAGGAHTVALKANGTLWTWGENGAGQLGDGSSTDRRQPVQVGTDADWIAIAAGSDHSLALKANGTLWAWGANQNSQLGRGALVPVEPEDGWGLP